MAPKFGTSGLRGLVTELTDGLVADHVAAFLRACPHGGAVYVGRDLRASSPAIAACVRRTVAGAGLRVVDCGVLPTPALALAAGEAGAAAVMVTGSHIPDDRNGLKFYTPAGEIAKHDEAAILAALGGAAPQSDTAAETRDAATAFAARYRDGFGPAALAGLRVGVYQHSSTARDMLVDLVAALGGTPVPLARSDRFIPVDTEAVDPDTRAMLARWCADHALDAVVSTDGDADRPMLTDATGRIVAGDVLGPLTALALGATTVCTPVSSNTGVDALDGIETVVRTRIGSPFVIAAMEAALRDRPEARVVGYEANGGFLLGYAAQGPAGALAPLMTRDCLLPILAPLSLAVSRGVSMADLVAGLPARFTAADRVAGIPTDRSAALIETLTQDPAQRAAFFEAGAEETALDLTDGLRVSFANGCVVHLRPSGNAPECRCYAEADSPARAEALVSAHLDRLRAALG